MHRRRRLQRNTVSHHADVLENRQLLTGLDFGDATTAATAGLIAGPELEGIQVAGEGIDVYPAFSPDILRYAVNPTGDTDGITVTPNAQRGDQVVVNGREVNAGASVELNDIANGETVTIEVSNDTDGTRTYELFYLPVDFPLEIQTNDTEAAADGSIYLTPRAQDGTTYLLKVDNNGVPELVHYTGGLRTFDFKLHDNGIFTYAQENGLNEFGTLDNEIVLLDSDFNEIDRISTVGEGLNHTDFHDFLFTPEGDYVFISYNGIVRDGVFYEDSIVQVVDAETNEQLLLWNSWDALDIEQDIIGGIDRLPEYAHINSVDIDDNGDFIVSLRWSSILKFDGETGETIWTFGGPRSQLETDDPWGGPCGQHTAQILSNGNLAFFDNGTPCPDTPQYANRPTGDDRRLRYAEYEIDERRQTATLVREIIHPTYAVGPTGSVQELNNGNVLISWGLPGRNFTEYSLAEYDQNDNIVREYSLDARGQVFVSYRAWLFENPDYPTLAADNGASHVIVDGIYLGSGVDADPDGQPSATSGDDVDVFFPESGTIGNDEDGVRFIGSLNPETSTTVEIDASTNGLLNAWIDFNNDGDWNDAGEQIFRDAQLTSGTNRLTFEVPAGAEEGITFSRFRFSTDGGLAPDGPAADGEVEDHRVEIEAIPEELLSRLNGEAGDNFGGDVAISGRFAAVAAPQQNGNGAVSIYRRTGVNSWAFVTEIQSPDRIDNVDGGDLFGHSVALDGGTLVVGAPLQENSAVDRSSGAVYVFGQDIGGEDNWGLVQRLQADDAARGDWFGNAVAIDGDTIVAGSRLADGPVRKNTGAAYVFSRANNGVWTQQVRLSDVNTVRDDQFGFSLDVEGNNLIVGAPRVAGDRLQQGAVYLYRRNDNNKWILSRKVEAPDTDNDVSQGDRFGYSVAIYRSLAVVGAFNEEADVSDLSSGAAYVLRRNLGGSNQWNVAARLTPSDSAIRDHFGFDVDITQERIAVGARTKETDAGIGKAGAAFIFDRVGNTDVWTETAKHEADDARAGDNLGSSIAITNRYLIAGAPLSDPNGSQSGKAYSFQTPAAASPLLATGVPPTEASDRVLTEAELQPIVEAAIEQWRQQPLTRQQLAILETLQISVVELGTSRLGEAANNSIRIDDNGADFGWYIDQTPFDVTDDDIGVSMDLLTVVVHEIGHALGYADTYRAADADEIMYGFLAAGERRTANSTQVEQVDALHAGLDFDLDEM